MRSGLVALALLLLALPAHADECPPGYRCVDRSRREQCVTDARALDRASLELDARLRDLRVLERQHQALGLTTDRLALALRQERSRLPAVTWWAIGGAMGVVGTVAV